MNILFLTVNSNAPSTRYRIFQYLPYFKEEGINCTVKSFFSSTKSINLYQNSSYKNNYIKIKTGIKGFWEELPIWLYGNIYDVIVIHRDLMLWGPFMIDREKWLKKFHKPIIIDYDDAVWLVKKNKTENLFSKFIKRIILGPNKKLETLLRMATHVVAGNNYLADYARGFNSKVSVIPTTVDTEHYKPIYSQKDINQKVIIGWIGSPSPFLNILSKVWSKLPNNVALKVVGDIYKPEGIEYVNIKWNFKTELKELASFDIGITPLLDNEWTRGKCGFKTLQYMSMAIPVVSSPVGVNKEIIQDGINGFLAKDEKEWIEKLALLIKNTNLRQKMGLLARKTVEERYSTRIWAQKWIDLVKEIKEKQ